MIIRIKGHFGRTSGHGADLQVFTAYKNYVVNAQRITNDGEAVIEYHGSKFYIPAEEYDILKTQQMYTEAEMKAIRSEWERLVFESGQAAGKEHEKYLGAKRKLDLLEPEIKRIEAAVNRVVPEDKEGYLADHVEWLVSELQRRRGIPVKVGDEVEIFDSSRSELNGLRGKVIERKKATGGPWVVIDAKNPLVEGFNGTGCHESGVILLTRKDEVVFHEFEHPEDQWAAQNAQELRDAIVKEAKEYVNDIADSVTFGAKVTYILKKYRVTCVIDHGKNFGNSRFLVGRADCNPDDCFNIHIGKAIALSRAINDSTPIQFLTAPRPTEKRFGDKIHTFSDQIIDDSREGF